MRKLVILASVVVLAASSVNCANSQGTSPVSPSISGPDGAAAKGGNGHGNSGTVATFALAMVDDANGNGAPDFGDTITFNVSTTATTDPLVSVACYQNGNIVFAAAWPSTPNINLASGAWQGGAADCTATLYYIAGAKKPVLATFDFTAGA